MARLAKATQAAFDELDQPCAAANIRDHFVPQARVALGELPAACCDSVARVAAALADRSNGEIPTGYGAAIVRHIWRRNEQLESLVRMPIEYRFALIELALLAGLASRWAEAAPPHVTVASHRDCVRQVAELGRPSHAEQREQWRRVIGFLLDSPSTTAIVLRNVAYALVWCGYFAPDGSLHTDQEIAQQFFRADRAEFVRFRQEALRWLPKLLELSLLPAGGGS